MSGSHFIAAAAVVVLLGAGGLRADLSKAKLEPNLERRARSAMDNADTQLRAASSAYAADDWGKTQAALEEMRESVDLAYASLKATGKAPRNSGQFKSLEIKTRTLLKNLEGFRQKMAFEEREQVAPMAAHIQQVHDEVLEAVMGPPKKKGKR